MGTFFSNQRDVWCDIEAALGEYDKDSILEYCKPNEKFDYDHSLRSMAAIEDSPDWIFKPILDEFLEEFRSWVDSISINGTKKILNLPIESKYLIFNLDLPEPGVPSTIEARKGLTTLIQPLFHFFL